MLRHSGLGRCHITHTRRAPQHRLAMQPNVMFGMQDTDHCQCEVCALHRRQLILLPIPTYSTQPQPQPPPPPPHTSPLMCDTVVSLAGVFQGMSVPQLLWVTHPLSVARLCTRCLDVVCLDPHACLPVYLHAAYLLFGFGYSAAQQQRHASMHSVEVPHSLSSAGLCTVHALSCFVVIAFCVQVTCTCMLL
jgi:hypothetical protein